MAPHLLGSRGQIPEGFDKLIHWNKLGLLPHFPECSPRRLLDWHQKSMEPDPTTRGQSGEMAGQEAK